MEDEIDLRFLHYMRAKYSGCISKYRIFLRADRTVKTTVRLSGETYTRINTNNRDAFFINLKCSPLGEPDCNSVFRVNDGAKKAYDEQALKANSS